MKPKLIGMLLLITLLTIGWAFSLVAKLSHQCCTRIPRPQRRPLLASTCSIRSCSPSAAKLRRYRRSCLRLVWRCWAGKKRALVRFSFTYIRPRCPQMRCRLVQLLPPRLPLTTPRVLPSVTRFSPPLPSQVRFLRPARPRFHPR